MVIDEVQTGYMGTDCNVADLMTKTIPKRERRAALLWQLMWDIYSYPMMK